MNEAEWLDWRGDPGDLLNVVRDRASERKLRLFACACCRRIWHLLSDNRSRAAVEASEAFADGNISLALLEEAHALAAEAGRTAAAGGIFTPAEHSAVAACYCVNKIGIIAFAAANRSASSLGDKKDAEQLTQCKLFRDVFGNPFRSVTFNSSWLATAVVTVAQSIYDDRTFDRMPELAHALEKAGCTNGDILTHCRGQGPHVRGCWVVDLLLGKA